LKKPDGVGKKIIPDRPLAYKNQRGPLIQRKTLQFDLEQ